MKGRLLRSCVVLFAMVMVVAGGFDFKADAQQGEARTVSRAEWKAEYLGRVALATELRKALENGVITRQEFSDAILLIGKTGDGVAAGAAKALELTQDYNEVLTRLMLDREVAAQPQAPDQNEGRVVSSANASWRTTHRGRVALVIQLRLAFDRGRITQEEMLQTRSLISALDDGAAAGAAKSFRRNGNYQELKTTLEQSQEPGTQDGGRERQCSTEAFGFFVGCVYAGGNPSDCDRQSFAYWCGCTGGILLSDDFCYVIG